MASRHNVQCGDIHLFWRYPIDFEGTIIAVPYSSLHLIGFEYLNQGGMATQHPLHAAIARLQDIPQLSTLTDPTLHPHYYVDGGMIFKQSRLEHSLLTAAAMEIVLRINERSEEEVAHGVTAALLHDAATVAGGDTMKMSASPGELAEEMLLDHILEEEDLRACLDINHIDPERIKAVIRNQGRLGKVLNFVDRLAYTCKDAQAMHRSVQHNQPEEVRARFANLPGVYFEKGREIAELLEAQPRLFDVLFDVCLDEEAVYVDNVDSAGHFLKLRALMHRDLYMDPIAHLFEATLLRPHLKKLYQQHQLSAEALLGWISQYRLENTLADALGVYPYYMITQYFINELAKRDIWVETCQPEEAARLKDVLQKQGRRIAAEENYMGGFDAGTDLLVKKDNLMPFRTADPQMAQEIETIAEQVRNVRIYHERM
ncbi:MAG TPA: HD domain-containing protein [Candidatus Nanoarchaeia archaeon]|nr:HD domain-containing protein [Candidatus Nanoarchaeia archaeon]